MLSLALQAYRFIVTSADTTAFKAESCASGRGVLRVHQKIIIIKNCRTPSLFKLSSSLLPPFPEEGSSAPAEGVGAGSGTTLDCVIQLSLAPFALEPRLDAAASDPAASPFKQVSFPKP